MLKDINDCAKEIAQLTANDRSVLVACVNLAITHGADDGNSCFNSCGIKEK